MPSKSTILPNKANKLPSKSTNLVCNNYPINFIFEKLHMKRAKKSNVLLFSVVSCYHFGNIVIYYWINSSNIK